MSVSCDFRKVLDAYPEQNTCVGIARTAKGGPRSCTERLSVASRESARDIMNVINKKQAASLQDIEDLASVMLCKEQHNNDLKPHLSQVDEVCVKWEAKIEQYKKIAEKEEAAAMILKSKRELSRLKRDADDLMSKMKTDRQEQASPSKRLVEGQTSKESALKNEIPIKVEASLDEDFIAPKAHRVSLSAKGNLSIFPPNYIKDPPSRQPSPRLPSSRQPSPRLPPANRFDEADRDTWCLLIQRPPTPPATPGTSRQRVHEKMDDVPRQSAMRKTGRNRSATTPSLTPRPKSNHRGNYIPEPKTPSKSVSFESLSRRSKVDTPMSVVSSDYGFGSTLQGPLPDFNFDFMSQLPEQRTSVAQPQEDSPTLARRTSGFEFGSNYRIPPKSFDFEKSTENASALWDEFVAASDSMKPAVPKKNRKSLPDTPQSMQSQFAASPKHLSKTVFQNRAKELPDTPKSLQSARYIETHTRASSSPHINTPPRTPTEAPPTRTNTPPRALSQRRLLSTPPLLQGSFPSPPSPRLLATPKVLSPKPSFTELKPEPTNPNRLSAILATLPPLPTKTPTSHTFDYGYGYATITPTAPHKTFVLPSTVPPPAIEVFTGPFDELSSPFPDFTIKRELRKERTGSIPRKPVPAPILVKVNDEKFNAGCGEFTPRTPRSNEGYFKGLAMRRWKKRVGRQMDGLKSRVVGMPERRVEDVVAGVGLRAASFGVRYSSLPC